MLLPTLFLPLFTSFFIGITGRKIGIQGTNIIVISSLILTVINTIIISYEVIYTGSPISINIGTWIDTGYSHFNWSFIMDITSAWLISTVLVISLLVHIFATNYMKSDPNPQKFLALLLAFTGFMVLLLAGKNIAVLFFGWEGIGITSYLLIGYWFDRSLAASAASQAIYVNRIGDYMLTVALIILLVLPALTTLDLQTINLIYNLSNIDNTYVNILGLLLILGAAGKSAQFLLHTWLPQAMEGPTPVSSLLHAATLVMSGIYLIVRLSSVLNTSSIALITATILGTITALFAATTAIVQNDIKRVIAYSTCSQFGYMFASVGLSQSFSTVLHLSSHAGFKALLFICAGGIIHSMRDEQDFRGLGGTISLLPFTYAAMLIASLSLMALPYLSGNTSKDLILELAASTISIPGQFLFILGSLIAGLTACYSIRLIALAFFGQPSASKATYSDIHEQPLGLIVPMVCLSIISIFFGYMAKEPLAGVGSDSIINYYLLNTSLVEAEFGLNTWIKNIPLISSLTGTLIGIYLFIIQPSVIITLFSTTSITYHALSNKWNIDSLYARIISWPISDIGLFASKIVDRGVLELIGVHGQTSLVSTFNTSLTTTNTTYNNNVPEYALYIGIIAIIITLMLLTYNIQLITMFIVLSSAWVLTLI